MEPPPTSTWSQICKLLKSSFTKISKFQVKWYNSKMSQTFPSQLPINRWNHIRWGKSHHGEWRQEAGMIIIWGRFLPSHRLWLDSETPFCSLFPSSKVDSESKGPPLTFTRGTRARNYIILRKCTAGQVGDPHLYPPHFLFPHVIILLETLQQIVIRDQEPISCKESHTREKNGRWRKKSNLISK